MIDPVQKTTKAGDQSSKSKRIESPGTLARRRFFQHRLAVIASLIFICVTILSFGAPFFTNQDPIGMNLGEMYQAPSRNHIMGTDNLGRSIFSRTLYGGRVSLLVGVTAAAISTLIGVVFGSLAGYYGGLVDMVVMRLTDIMMTFPPLIIMLTVVSITGPGLRNVILIIGGLVWPETTRLIRGQFLTLVGQEFVLAAKAQGLPDWIIIFRHCLPNVMAPLMARISFAVSGAILSEAGLSFLGIGVPSPTPTWGNMMQNASNLDVLQFYPWMWVFPAIFTLVVILCINFIGDGLRDAFDPRQMLGAPKES
jgi:peptide/nickel transport system permease protein